MVNSKAVIENLELSKTGESLYLKFFGLEHNTQIILFHDIGEYHDRYQKFVDFCLLKEVGVTLIDMRGHGLSSGTRGHVDSYEQLLEDYQKFWREYHSKYQDKFVLTLGHGVGALLSIMFLIDNVEIDGGILINPTISFRQSKTLKLEQFLGSASLLGKIRVGLKLGGDDVTTEKNLSYDYNHDPLVNRKVTLSMYKALLRLFEDIKKQSYYLNKPILYVMGLEDNVVDKELGELFASSIDSKIVSIKKYKDLGHEFFNEIDRDKGFKDIYNFIKDNFILGNL